MDKTQAWTTTSRCAKTAYELIEDATTLAVIKWRDSTERRRTVRTVQLPVVRDCRKALAAARKADPEQKSAAVHKARSDLQKTLNSTPDPMWVFASKSAIAAAITGWVVVPRLPASVWTGALIMSLAMPLALLVWAFFHTDTTDDRLIPTAEETKLLDRLATEHWVGHAETRGLDGTVTGKATLTESGIVCAVRLDGKWTPGKFKSAEDSIRALLGCRKTLRLELSPGQKGGWAEMVLRTRLAVDSTDMTWHPGVEGMGLDMVTGEPVHFSPYTFRLVAGTTGMGKSVAMRPSMAEVLANPVAALVFIDPKHQEYRLWRGKCRVEDDRDAIYALVCELYEEMLRRQKECTGTTWTPTVVDPELVIVVDEGAAIVRMAKDKRYKDILDMFEAIATMGRAAKMWLTWATQYPTKEQGIPAQVVEMMLSRLALSVESSISDRVIFGDKAAEKGWQPSELGGEPGIALVRTKVHRAPTRVKTWYLDDDRAADLPGGIVWQAGGQVEASPTVNLTLVKSPDDEAQVGQLKVQPADLRVDPLTLNLSPAEGQVLKVAQELGQVPGQVVRQQDLIAATGLSKGTVSKAVKKLVDLSLLTQFPDKTICVSMSKRIA